MRGVTGGSQVVSRPARSRTGQEDQCSATGGALPSALPRSAHCDSIQLRRRTHCTRSGNPPRRSATQGFVARELVGGLIMSLIGAALLIETPVEKLHTAQGRINGQFVGTTNSTLPGEWLVDDDVDETDVPPAQYPQPSEHIVKATGCLGEPYCLVAFELICANEDVAQLYPDQGLRIFDDHARIFAPITSRSYQVNETGDENWNKPATSISGFALVSGTDPIELKIAGPKGVIATSMVEFVDDELSLHLMQQRWWDAFCSVNYSDSNNRRLHRGLVELFSERMGLEPIPQSNRNELVGSDIEQAFERTISTLLGIDSLLLSMDQHESTFPFIEEERGNSPLPNAIRIPSVAIPEHPPVTVEPIARFVPEECFYVRCRTAADLAWLRSFLMQWGGGIGEIVSQPAWQNNTRAKLERQLALQLDVARSTGIDDVISDLALIGTDLQFVDGAGVGVIFEARDGERLTELLLEQREEALANNPLASASHRSVGRSKVSCLQTSDNSIRSFFAQSGNYFLITNSFTIAERFLAAAKGEQNLADLREFRYAKSKSELQEDIYFYLSDPFFRNVVRPEYHIEMQRRARALHELTQVELGRALALSDGLENPKVDTLMEQNYISENTGKRSDQGRPFIAPNGRVLDSLRGARGVFTPIPDMGVFRCNREERTKYANFLPKYQRQWRRVDPIIVSFDRQGVNRDGLEQIGIQIWVTPYARDRYSFFDNFLTDVDKRIVIDGDLFALNAGFKNKDEPTHFRVGIRDDSVPFEIAKGEVVRHGDFATVTLGERNQYAVTDSKNAQTFSRLKEFIDSINSVEPVEVSRGVRGVSPATMSAGLLMPAGWTYGALRLLVKGIDLLGAKGDIEQDGDWSVFASAKSIRESVPSDATFESSSSHLMRFQLADVRQTNAARYVNAYAYMDSLKLSAETANALTLFEGAIRSTSTDPVRTIEKAFGLTPCCPLGGTYHQPNVTDGSTEWTSSAWTKPSYYQLTEAPASYSIPFLNWMRGMEVTFDLDAQTLHAQVSMTIDPSGDRRDGDSDFLIPGGAETAQGDGQDQSGIGTLRPSSAYLALTSAPASGETLYVRVGQADLHVGNDTTRPLKFGDAVQVIEVKGGWVGIYRRVGSEVMRGWLRGDELGRERE